MTTSVKHWPGREKPNLFQGIRLVIYSVWDKPQDSLSAVFLCVDLFMPSYFLLQMNVGRNRKIISVTAYGMRYEVTSVRYHSLLYCDINIITSIITIPLLVFRTIRL
jgi:hypothetical protein